MNRGCGAFRNNLIICRFLTPAVQEPINREVRRNVHQDDKDDEICKKSHREAGRSPAFAGRHDLCHCLAAALACLQDDFEACITHLSFPLAHRQAIRSTNLLEQLFGEERRRTKVIPHAFGERAMLKLMYAASDPSRRTLARLAHDRIRAPTADRHS